MSLREIILLQKLSKGCSTQTLQNSFESLSRGLQIQLKIIGKVENDWVKIIVSGNDQKVTEALLKKKFGFAPVTKRNIILGSRLRGIIRLDKQDQRENCLYVDVGVLQPKPVYALVPKKRLQGQLVGGRKYTHDQICTLFGFIDGYPIHIRITKISNDHFQAELTESQLSLFHRWVHSRLDRLIFLCVSNKTIQRAIRKARLEQYVVRVDPVSFLTQVVVCKLGTDHTKLVSKLERYVPNVCAFFSPKRILMSTGELWLSNFHSVEYQNATLNDRL